jgi:tetratricopeptide (TPR) repeat protein
MFPLTIRTAIVFAAVCLTVVVSGCGGAQSRKAKHLEKGESFLAAGNFEKARIEFRNALQIVPTDSEARYANGVVDEKLGNLREAAQFYQAAIDSNADAVRAQAHLGRLYLFSGAPDKALATVAPALAKHPEDAALLTVRAAARIQLKDPVGALADAEHAVKLAPSDEDAVSVLAGIYKSQGDVDKAQALLQEAIKRTPNTIELRLVLAQLDAGLGRNDEVESLLNEIVRLRPAEKNDRLRLAQFYARANQLDSAEKVLRDGIRALPAEHELKMALINFLATRRTRELAEQELTKLIATDPKDEQLKFLEADFYERGKEFPKAEQVYRDIIAADGVTGQGLAARNRLAALLVQLNDAPGAEKLIAEVLAASPRDNDALILRGNLALAQKDPRTAIADLRSVLRDQPNSVGVMRSLARAHLANGEPALAEETMRRALEINPSDSGARLDLAQLLSQLGKADAAKPIIDELVKQHPEDAQALDLQFKVALATKDLVIAHAAADALVATQPKAAVGYYYQGELAESERHAEEALRLYSTALELQPEVMEPLGSSARVLIAMKRLPDALKRLDDYIERYPKLSFPANLKGELLLASKRAADSVPAFKLAIDREPTWWVPYRNLAVAQAVADKDNVAAAETLKAGIAKAATPETLEVELASLYEHGGRVDEALQVYENALRVNPKNDVMANNLAMMLVTYRKDAASLNRAKQLVTRFAASPNPTFLDTYGWVQYKSGEATAAVTTLQDVLAKVPNAAVPLYHLGMAQVLAGEPDAARDSLRRSLESGTSFTGIEEAKATLDRLAKEAAPAGAPTKS